MSKAIFFDIDGTLVNFRGQMPESARQALRQAQAMGHQIVLCSGRSKMQIYPWLLELGFNGIVAATGAYVECNGEVIYTHYMPKDIIHKAALLLEEAGACYSAQAKDRMIAPASNIDRQIARFREMGVKGKTLDQIWQNVQIEEQIWQIGDIEKLLYYESKITVGEIRERLLGICDVTESSFEKPQEDSGEITCCGINKAFGMQKYIDYAGIAKEDTVAFGDGPNDLDMLQFAATSVAMGNARDSVKQMAGYVADGIDEDGVAKALKELKLIP